MQLVCITMGYCGVKLRGLKALAVPPAAQGLFGFPEMLKAKHSEAEAF